MVQTTRTLDAAPAALPLPLLVGGAAAVTASIALTTAGLAWIPWLIGTVAGCYILTMRNRAWALAAFIIVEQSLSGYIPGTSVSLRFGTTVLSTVFAAAAMLKLVATMDAQLRRVLLPSIAFLGFVTVLNLLHSDLTYVGKYFRYQLTQLLPLLIAAAVLRKRQDLHIVLRVALAIGLASALLAILQHYMRSDYLYAIPPDRAGNWKGRSLGLVDSPVILANQLTFVLPALLGILACGPMRADRPRIILGTLAIAILWGLYFTYTRSALLALGPGIVAVALFLRGERRWLIIGAVVAVGLVFQFAPSMFGSRYSRGVDEDQSAASHMAVWQIGMSLALDNWAIGIGHEAFEEASVERVGEVTQTGAVNATASIGNAKPHNDFLNVWFSWGILALLSYLAVFGGALVNLRIAARSPDWLIRGLAIGSIGALVTYAVNSTLHNYLDSSAFLWIYAGLSVALVRLAATSTATISSRRRRVHLLRARSTVPRARARRPMPPSRAAKADTTPRERIASPVPL